MIMLQELINEKKVLVADGAWGTMLQTYYGAVITCPEILNIEKPEIIQRIASEYCEAGADIIETNTFGGSLVKLEKAGYKELCYEINKTAAELVKNSIKKGKLTAGSIGPCGKMLFLDDITEEEVYESFKLQAEGLRDGGADIFIIETFYSKSEVLLAFDAVRSISDRDIIVSITPSNKEKTMMGDSIIEIYTELGNKGAKFIGMNCGEGFGFLNDVYENIKESVRNFNFYISPNAGIPEIQNGKIVYSETPEKIGKFVKNFVNNKISIVGGCCGTNPEHIREIRKIVDEIV